MSAEDVELVRRIYASWDRGDFSDASWAADDIHFQIVDSLVPVDVRGAAAMGPVWREWLEGWRDFRTRGAQYRDLDDAVLTVHLFGGEGRSSGLVPDARAAALWTIRDGKVVRLVLYLDAERALAQLAIDEG